MSQQKAIKLIRGKAGFFFSPKEVHEWSIALKENIANYCLVIHLFIMSNRPSKANELFLLLDQQNRDLLTSICVQIKKNFRNMSNSNRIGKFYPSIIKIFFQILSVIIKYSAKFNKNLIENYYLKMYIETIYVIRETIIKRFISVKNDVENDFKLLGRFFYYNSIYTISIFFLYRYQPLNITISILQFILEQYHEKDLINSEQLLLLKIYYNLGLLYYIDGNTMEAIIYLNQGKDRIKDIAYFPYTPLNDNMNQVTNTTLSTSKLNSNNEYTNNPDRTSISSFNIDESVDKFVTGRTALKKRSISSRVNGDMLITERNFEVAKRVSSNIKIGKEKFIFKEQAKFINDCISEKMTIEIELFLAEIELEQKNYDQSFKLVNKILDNARQPSKIYSKELSGSTKRMFNMDSSLLNNNNYYFKLSDYNKNSYSNKAITNDFNIPKIQLNQIISESNRRHISYILEEIEQEYKKRSEYGNSNSELNNMLNEDYKSYKSKTDRYEYDKRLNENIKRENKISLETEKFFIFICGLSLYQLKVLNEFQPKPSRKRDDLPILFPNQFKDCLTFSQRLALNNLDTMSLSRYVVLKDSTKDISPENLDYVFLTRKIKSSHKDKNLDLTSDKNNNDYYNEIMKKLSVGGSDESSVEVRDNPKRDNLKMNLFDKKNFQKYLEEDKMFNQKITEITKKDSKKFLEINRNKILKILHGLKAKEKQLLMKSSKCFNDFMKKIEKKMSKKKLDDIQL